MAAAALPKQQHVVVYDKSSTTDGHGIRFRTDYPVPTTPGRKQVLVRVHAAGLNPVDFKMPSVPVLGWMRRGKPIGYDFSGEVIRMGRGLAQQEEATGSGSIGLGDAVYGRCNGSVAEYVVVDVSSLARKPGRLSHEQAAALPTAGLSGLQALREGGMQKGARVLVIGASGGCGHLGVQMAKAMGAARVVGICSAANAKLARDCGADRVIAYDDPLNSSSSSSSSNSNNDVDVGVGGGDSVEESNNSAIAEALAEESEPFDLIYDTVASADACDHSYEAEVRPMLRNGCTYVMLNGGASDWRRRLTRAAIGYNAERKHTHLVIAATRAEDLKKMATMADEGTLNPIIQQVIDTENVSEAFAFLKSRRVKGKLVVRTVRCPRSDV